MAMKTLAPAIALLLTACASAPTGPSVMVLPGSGKSFEQFQAEDAACRQWAAQQTETTQTATPAQHRYDISYMQCMYAKGNQLPVARSSQAPQPQSGPLPTSPASPPDLRGTWTGTWADTPLKLMVLNQEVVPVSSIYIGPWPPFAQHEPGIAGILTYTVRDEAVSVNVRGRFGFSNGARTLYLDPQSGYGQQITLTRVDQDRMAGVGTSLARWEPSGPVELVRQTPR
jgi:hypothetical protein